MKRLLGLWALLALSVSPCACSEVKEDAQIVIVVDSDFPVPSQLNEVSFYVKRVGAGEELAQTLTVPLTGRLGKTLPLRLGIAPESDTQSAVDVRVEGYLITDPMAPRPEPVVRRRARVRFQRGKILLLRMDLVAVCAFPKWVECEAASGERGTCDESGCSDAHDPAVFPWTGSDQAHVPVFDGGAGSGDASTAPDADVPPGDGDGDGNGDGDADGGDGPDTSDGGEPQEPERPVQLALGELHSCVLTSRGNVWCWGAGAWGQLGDGTVDHGQTCSLLDADPVDCSPTPVKVSGLSGATQLSAGVHTSCAVHAPLPISEANVSCWGEVVQGDNASAPLAVPFRELLLDDVAEVRVGGRHTCVRRNGKLPVCWGEYVSGELGNGDTETYPEGGIAEASALMGRVPADEIASIHAGDRHSCLQRTNGELWCWGNNELGQCGQPLTSELVVTPAEMESVGLPDTVAVGGAHACVLVQGEGAYCFGHATFGQLGIGNVSELPECPGFARCTPTPIKVLDEDLDGSIVQLAPGYEFTCVRLSSGDVACFGRNQLGQLGPKAASTAASVPVDTTVKNAVDVAAGATHACAILMDGSVMCWGRNDAGQLGVAADSTGMSKVPVKVPLPF